jgi:hypothetical protein
MKCDAKAWASMNLMLVPLVEGMVTPAQKGFMCHRIGVEHIIEADFHGLDFERRYPKPAHMFLDRQAVFPRIAHSFVSHILRKRLGDCPLFRAIANLYSVLTSTIQVAGVSCAEFSVESSVRQVARVVVRSSLLHFTLGCCGLWLR